MLTKRERLAHLRYPSEQITKGYKPVNFQENQMFRSNSSQHVLLQLQRLLVEDTNLHGQTTSSEISRPTLNNATTVSTLNSRQGMMTGIDFRKITAERAKTQAGQGLASEEDEEEDELQSPWQVIKKSTAKESISMRKRSVSASNMFSARLSSTLHRLKQQSRGQKVTQQQQQQQHQGEKLPRKKKVDNSFLDSQLTQEEATPNDSFYSRNSADGSVPRRALTQSCTAAQKRLEERALRRRLRGNPYLYLLTEYVRLQEAQKNSQFAEIDAISPSNQKRKRAAVQNRNVRLSILAHQELFLNIQNNNLVRQVIKNLQFVRDLIATGGGSGGSNQNAYQTKHSEPNLEAAVGKLMTEICTHIEQLKNIELFLKAQFVHAALLQLSGLADEAIRVHKDTLKYCNYYHYFYGKAQSYRLIARIMLETQQIQGAKHYTKKLLCHAWYYSDKETELYCYAQIANIYFYEGNVPLAQQFYSKAILGGAEVRPGNQRATFSMTSMQQALKKLLEEQARHKESLLDDTFEEDALNLTYFAHQDEQNTTERAKARELQDAQFNNSMKTHKSQHILHTQHSDTKKFQDSNYRKMKNLFNKLQQQNGSAQKLGVVRFENRQILVEAKAPPMAFKERANARIYVQHLSHARQHAQSSSDIQIINKRGQYNQWAKNLALQRRQSAPLSCRLITQLQNDLSEFCQQQTAVTLTQTSPLRRGQGLQTVVQSRNSEAKISNSPLLSKGLIATASAQSQGKSQFNPENTQSRHRRAYTQISSLQQF